MSASGEENSCTLTGVIVSLEAVRYTPAGIPRQRLWLEHRSRQQEDGQPREAQARMAVVASGEKAVAQLAALNEGARVRVQGFIARAGYRGEAQERLQLHLNQIDCLD